ncbi:MAG: hypothetical protein MR952_06385 [Flavonifractor plautii]|nr:hypothetical protein [Flavonifractor plautii]
MKVPTEFEGVFRDIELTEREIGFLVWVAGWDSYTIENLKSVVQKVQATRVIGNTLQPSNESLTLEELLEMDEPVWCACKPIEGGNGYWCLCKHGCIVAPSGNSFDVGAIPHWVFYRRPPEETV